MTDQLEGQLSLFDLDTSYLKMFPDSCHQETPKDLTSKSPSRKSSKSQARMLPMCLCLKTEDGQRADAYTMSWEDGALLGDFMMHSTGEQPYTMMTEMSFNEVHRNGVNVSHLSQILVDSAHPKYYLSAKACSGILRRAETKGKQLPEVLKDALINQMNRGNGSDPQN